MFVAVDANREIFRDLWYMDLLNGGKPTPFLESPFDEFQAVLSVDSRYLAYVSNESGTYEVYVRPFPKGAGKWKVSDNGGVQPRWDAAEKRCIMSAATRCWRFQWTPCPIFSGAGRGTLPWRRHRSPAFHASRGTVQFYDVALDEQRFVVVQPILPRETGFVVIENWVSQLGR